jgi:soluble lytic murein transglycosylase
MSRLKNLAVGIGAALGLVALAAVAQYAFNAGERAEAARGAERVKVSDAVEAKIMEIVLKRNPDAPYRDFVDFPRVLLTESKTAGLDFRLVMALIDKESQFNPRAIGKAGEIGLMQVMPDTGAKVAKALDIKFEAPSKGSLGTLGVPKYNLRIGIRFLKDRVDEFGGVNEVALRGYNRGPMTAREHRPNDRYAEEVALKYMMFVTAFDRGGPVSMVPKSEPKVSRVIKETAPPIVVASHVAPAPAPVMYKHVGQTSDRLSGGEIKVKRASWRPFGRSGSQTP